MMVRGCRWRAVRSIQVQFAWGQWTWDGTQACASATLLCTLLGCAAPDGRSDLRLSAGAAPTDAIDQVRTVDLSPRFPAAIDGQSGTTSEPSQPLIFPGSTAEPEPQRDRDPEI